MLTTTIVGLVLRATLLMGLGLVIAKLFERRSAVLAHRVLAVTVGCVILLPIVSMLGPKWEWTRPQYFTQLSSSITWPDQQDAGRQPDSSDVPPPNSMVPADDADVNHSHFESTWNATEIGLSLWICGSLIMLARLAAALLQLRGKFLNSDEAEDLLACEVQSMATAFRVRDLVHVRVANAEAMPMVFWSGRWVLILPDSIQTWHAELKRATLCHELGHIARRDVWVDYAIQGLICLWWWHPMAWSMARAVTRLREQACDEWVLQSCNLSPRSYAHSLLEVIRRCQFDECRLSTPMATPGELEGRLRHIASPQRSQQVRRWWLTACGLVIGALATFAAVVSFVNNQQSPLSANTPGIFGDDQLPKDLAGSIVTGLVTHEGKPIAGLKVKLLKVPEGKPNKLHAIVTTDDSGRYTIPGMHPGEQYQLEIQSKGSLMVRNWHYQSPWVPTVTGVEGETIELPEAKMISNTQVLKGTVVDPAGKPVEGVSVSASLATGEMLSRTASGQTPWTETDKLGRFTLSNLPNEAIELMVYRHNPEGGRILHPSKLKVPLNKRDIRMIFDPSLGSGIEDLDAH